jgi:hypothetical protein
VPSLTVDIALTLPAQLRQRAILSSELLAQRMATLGHPSAFRLGRPFPGSRAADHCEPHVSVFMLAVEESEVGRVLAAAARTAAAHAPVTAAGQHWGLNPQGAPELYLRQSDAWVTLQRAVVAAIEPLRRGRLRAADPAGTRLAGLVAELRRDGSDPERLRQLEAYGYDEVTDGFASRFRPHVTVAWPAGGAFEVSLDGLPPPADFDGVLSGLGVFGMGPNGTCTRRYGEYVLGGRLTAV